MPQDLCAHFVPFTTGTRPCLLIICPNRREGPGCLPWRMHPLLDVFHSVPGPSIRHSVPCVLPHLEPPVCPCSESKGEVGMDPGYLPPPPYPCQNRVEASLWV